MCVKAPRSQYVWLVSCPQLYFGHLWTIQGFAKLLRLSLWWPLHLRSACVSDLLGLSDSMVSWVILLGIQTSHSSAPVHTGSCLAGKGWEGSRIRESPKCLNIGSCMILSIIVHLQSIHTVYMIRVIYILYIYIQYILYIYTWYMYIYNHTYLNIISYIIYHIIAQTDPNDESLNKSTNLPILQAYPRSSFWSPIDKWQARNGWRGAERRKRGALWGWIFIRYKWIDINII